MSLHYHPIQTIPLNTSLLGYSLLYREYAFASDKPSVVRAEAFSIFVIKMTVVIIKNKLIKNYKT